MKLPMPEVMRDGETLPAHLRNVATHPDDPLFALADESGFATGHTTDHHEDAAVHRDVFEPDVPWMREAVFASEFESCSLCPQEIRCWAARLHLRSRRGG